jgi:MFS family permease
MTIVTIRLIDRVGRKPLLLGGLVGMVASLTVLGLSLSIMSEPTSPGDPAAIITLICLGTFIASFAATWGPVVWVMLPEILPLSVRGAALGVAVCLHGWRTSRSPRHSPSPSTPGVRAPCSSATRSSA